MLHQDTAADWTHPVDLIEPEDDQIHSDLDVAEIGSIPLDALRIFCSFLIPKIGGPARWRAAAARLAVLSHALKVDGIGGQSLTALAAEIGCSRSLLSLMEVELRMFGQLDHRGGKSDAAREVYSRRARDVWSRRRGAVGDDSTEPTKAPQRRSSTREMASQ